MNLDAVDRDNPLQIEGLAFVEYRTARPQALGQVLEAIGFRPVARHRSREVMLYRQGEVNVVVDAHGAIEDGPPLLSGFALRVRDAAAAHRRVVELGGWDVPVRVAAMELAIPAVHGVGASRVWFVDRWREFSIFDIDFVRIPGTDPQVPVNGALRVYGLVQQVGPGRTPDWMAFWRELFGFRAPGGEREPGVLPDGEVLRSPCGGLHLQLVESQPPAAAADDGPPSALHAPGHERLLRLAFGVPDVAAAARAWRERGVGFVERDGLVVGERGAVTQSWLGGLRFELIRDRPATAATAA